MFNQALEQEQFNMVADLAKPGEAILASLTPRKCHIQHMVGAMYGESREIKDFTDIENLTEELGDYKFYLYGLYAVFGLTTQQVLDYFDKTVGEKVKETLSELPISELMDGINKQSFELFDLHKKWHWHGKPKMFLTIDFEPTDDLIIHMNDSVMLILGYIEVILARIQHFHNITHQETLEHNQKKLWKGEKARHASGKYSDQAQTDRADKQGD